MNKVNLEIDTFINLFPDTQINISTEFNKLKKQIDQYFDEDIKNIRKYINENSIVLKFNNKNFTDRNYLLQEVLYNPNHIPEKGSDNFRFNLANLHICKNSMIFLHDHILNIIIP